MNMNMYTNNFKIEALAGLKGSESIILNERTFATGSETLLTNTSLEMETGFPLDNVTEFEPQTGEASANTSGADCCTAVTTTFASDASEVTETYSSVQTHDVRDHSMPSIAEFMAKPYLVANGTGSSTGWKTSQTAGTEITSFRIADYIQSGVTTYFSNKLQGFNLVRATAVVRLSINASPFHQGKLLLHFLPLEKDFAACDASYVLMHNANLVTRRQQPCVELDCRDTMAILKIPYIAPSYWYDIKRDQFGWGKVYLAVLSALNVGSSGEANVDYSMWLSFEDVELSAPLAPQSGSGASYRKPKAKRGFSSTTSKEADDMSSGPISKALALTSKAADSASAVPILAPIMKPVSWATNIMSGLAGVFGWSKPDHIESSMVVSRQYNKFSATSDGVDNSIPVTLLAENRLKVIDNLSPVEQDEMSWNYLKKVSTWISSYTWNDTDVAGTALSVAWQIYPGFMYKAGTTTHTAHTANWRTGPPIYYISRNFQFWRGSIEMTIKFAKTEFHSGRLQITFTPYTGGSFTSPTLSTSMMSLRTIVDLRESNEVTLKLPWLVQEEYLPYNVPSGQLDILVLNELRHPETAASSVEMLFYVCGGDDLELAVPSQISSTPYAFVPQSGCEPVVQEVIGGSSDKSQGVYSAEECIGEMFTSIKQLLNRFTQTYFSTGLPVTTGNQFGIFPYWTAALYVTAGGTLTGPNVGGDAFNLYNSMYVFYRGGARVQLQWIGAGQANVSLCPARLVPGTTKVMDSIAITNASTVSLDWRGNGNVQPICGVAPQENGVGVISLRIPYQGKYRATLSTTQFDTDVVNNNPTTPYSYATIGALGSQPFNSGYTVYRSFTDDFQLSYFIGCPPVFISYA
jgi:hypothetical protein